MHINSMDRRNNNMNSADLLPILVLCSIFTLTTCFTIDPDYLYIRMRRESHDTTTPDPDLASDFGGSNTNSDGQFFGHFDPMSAPHLFDLSNVPGDQGHSYQGQGSDTSKGDQSPPHNPLIMTQAGELPPLALPLSQDAGTGMDTGHGNFDGSPSYVATSDGGYQHSQGSDGGFGNSDMVPMEGHDMPVAQAMTGAETLGDTPMALAQKARRPGAKKGPGGKRPAGGAPVGNRAAPNWKPKQGQQGGAPKGSLAGQKAASPQPTPGSLGDNRQAPQWGGGGAGATGGGGLAVGGGLSPMGMASLGMGMDGMNPMESYGDMLEMQRKMMFDPQYNQQYMNMMQQYQRQQLNAMSNLMASAQTPGANSTGNGSAPIGLGPGFQYNPLLAMGGEGLMGDGYNMNFLSGLGNPMCTDPNSPICKLQAMGMSTETQIEGPMGEMDIEPGELDIEGPIANMLLRQLNFGRPNVHPLHQEITLNHHVLQALQRKFGVNTTLAIQQKSNDPQFRAFMFQVLKKSAEVAPGEFNANLAAADVAAILASIEATPVAQPRIASSEFAHASLVDIPAPKGVPARQHGAVLSLDSGSGAPSGHTLPLVGQPQLGQGMAMASGASTASGSTAPGATAQKPTFEVLVQDVVGTGVAELPDKDKKKKTGTPTPTQAVAATVPATNQSTKLAAGQQAAHAGHLPGQPAVGHAPLKATAASAANKTSPPQTQIDPLTGLPIITQSGSPAQAQNTKSGTGVLPGAGITKPGSTGSLGPTVATGVKVAGDIKNKDGTPGLSKDAITANKQANPGTNTAPGQAASGAVGAAGVAGAASGSGAVGGAASGSGTVGGAASGSGSVSSSGANLNPNPTNSASPNAIPGPGATTVDGRPIGLQEAGLYPGGTNGSSSWPVLKKDQRYGTSTVFAIVAITLIALAIIIGPILCMLCKMKEKRDQRLRKMRALKNREVSENNIMEAMMLHDLGTKEMTSVENHGATGGNLYQTIDPELEPLNHGRTSPTGRLP